MAASTQFPTAQDAPRVVTSETKFDLELYESLDAQIQALGRELVEQRGRAFTCCYPKADPDGGTLAAGRAVAIKAALGANDEPVMVLATSANIAAGAVFIGVLTETTAAGTRGRVARGGVIPPSVSGLGSGAAQFVRANATTAALERVSAISSGDVNVGKSTAAGAVSVSPAVTPAFDPTTPGPIGGTTPSTATFTTLTLTSPSLTTINFAPAALALIGQLAKPATAASQAGTNAQWVAQPATAGTSTPGAAAGGGFEFFAGNAARFTSGDANGGGYKLRLGAGIGAGTAGNFTVEQPDGSVLVRVDYFGGIAIGKTAPGSSGLVGLYIEDNDADLPCKGLFFQSQPPFPSATGTNRNAANITYKIPGPISGGTHGKHSFDVSGAERARVVTTGIEYNGSVRAVDGTPPNFGRAAVEMPADANFTVPSSQTGCHILDVTSAVVLTLPRDVIAPLADGAEYIVRNGTGGGQSIVLKGATGTGVTITNGSTARVWSDGTNYYPG